jgi:putative copper export protein
VALVAIAGVALAFVRLGSVSALWATPYGVTLVVKVALVAVVGGIGAYNHYVVVPVLRVTPDHAIGRRLRWLGYVELTMFVAVIGVNSSLVGLAG